MKTTIVQLQTIAGILRGFRNTEPEADRLIAEYLEVVPCQSLIALESEHEDAIAAWSKDFDEKRDQAEEFDSKFQKLTETYEACVEKAETELIDLRSKLMAVSERSDSTAPGDAGMVAALQTALFVERAKIKQLEAYLALPEDARPGVQPLDSRRDATPARKASTPDPKARRPDAKPKAEPARATAPPVLTLNPERGGIELRFNGKPDEPTLAALQDHKWRWAPRQPGTPWYAKHTEEQYLFAQSLATGSAYTPMPAEPESEPGAVTSEPEVAPRRRVIIPPF
jgi:hypothetical protein